MNINRNNYEEYFLLYTDNELSAVEKAAVDAFIQQNPDLATELTMLQQTVLLHEDAVFNGKELLLKYEGAGINSLNAEEKFLLYVDNELAAEEKNEVETFVLQHPAMQTAFTAINQTKLPIEHIGFPHKNELYKKEKRVVYMSWQRVAVAAVFIGLIVLVYNIIPTKSVQTIAPTAKTEIKKEANPSTKNKINTVEENKIEKQLPIANANPTTIAVQKTKADKIINNNNSTVQPIIVQQPQSPVNNQVAVNTPNEVVPQKNQIITPPKETVAVKANDIIDIPVTNTVAKNNKPDNNIIHNTVYKELNTDDDEKGSVYLGNMEINKDKLRGLIKKAGRLFNKNREEESKLSIASIPINTKQSK